MVRNIVLMAVMATTVIFPFFTDGIDRANCYLGAITIMLCYKIFQPKEKGGKNE